MMKLQRLQKFLANHGLASRREIEQWISLGKVTVDGRVAELGEKVSGDEVICVDQKRVAFSKSYKQPLRMLLYHKPLGVICTRFDRDNRPTVFADLPAVRQERWVMVGRLDINSSGLLLFTNNGDLAHRLMHPSYNLEREYLVRVLGRLTEVMVKRLLQGVRLEDGIAKFTKIHYYDRLNNSSNPRYKKEKKSFSCNTANHKYANHWYRVSLTRGRNREVRRLFQSQGVSVNRLIRIRYGDVLLPSDLKPGSYLELTDELLRKFLGNASVM